MRYLIVTGVLLTAFICGPAAWVLATHPSSLPWQAAGPHATNTPYLTPT